MTITEEKQRVHELVDQIPDSQMQSALRFLESLVSVPAGPVQYPEEDEEISEEEEKAVAIALKWYKHNEGIPFEQVVEELGFTMDDIRRGNTDSTT